MAGADGDRTEADAGAASRKRSRLIALTLLAAGLIAGGGGASAYFLLTGGAGAAAALAPEASETPQAPPAFVSLNRLTVPLVAPGGALSGYVNLDLQLEVGEQDADFVKARMPLVRHAINHRLSTTSVADARNPLLLDYDAAETVLRDAANESLGKPVVRTVQITTVLPL
ncbi:flagellar basal body-associated FliL family protein [Pedomonas sp. V897]|uniref:flagellar basal body-associated FliL family protein n=1 Tax=Pedomonas sp. V897 TaxID=3446482 RepID=UPI003EE1D8FE